MGSIRHLEDLHAGVLVVVAVAGGVAVQAVARPVGRLDVLGGRGYIGGEIGA